MKQFLYAWLQFFVLSTIGSIIIGMALYPYTKIEPNTTSPDSNVLTTANATFYIVVIALEAVLSLILCYIFFYRKIWLAKEPNK